MTKGVRNPSPTCKIGGCDGLHEALGWCNAHYLRWSRTGSTESRKRSSVERFWASVDKTDECWLWLQVLLASGYGKFYANGRQHLAHRYAYELLVGPIPDGLQIDHLCRVKNCVRPDHLEPVTPGVNTRRARAARAA